MHFDTLSEGRHHKTSLSSFAGAGLLLFALMLAGCQAPAPDTEVTEYMWIPLFDGSAESFEQAWRVYNEDGLPDHGWQVEDELLVFRPPQDEDWTSGLDIITRETFEDFELELEWMVTEAGNSGIFYHVLEQPAKEIYWSGLEMQVLDNENHPDANMGVDGNRQAGSLYDLIPAEPQNARPFGEWNTVRIVSDGNTVQHYQNGELVVEYERFTPEWFEMLRNSKFSEHNEFGAIRNGHIGLQDHGDVVMFRNMRIKKL